jgi:hypothetical protein
MVSTTSSGSLISHPALSVPLPVSCRRGSSRPKVDPYLFLRIIISDDVIPLATSAPWGVLVPKATTMTEERIGSFRVILRFDSAGDREDVD